MPGSNDSSRNDGMGNRGNGSVRFYPHFRTDFRDSGLEANYEAESVLNITFQLDQQGDILRGQRPAFNGMMDQFNRMRTLQRGNGTIVELGSTSRNANGGEQEVPEPVTNRVRRLGIPQSLT